MKDEFDFSEGVRGKFHKLGMRLILPVRLDPQVLNFLADRAQANDTTINELLNALLKNDIELIQAASGNRSLSSSSKNSARLSLLTSSEFRRVASS